METKSKRIEMQSNRYEIRPVGPTDSTHGEDVDTLGAVIRYAGTPEAAKLVARLVAENHYWGVAIVDSADGTVDFGDGRIEPLRKVRAF
jgi:hypothetical protein